MELGRNREGLGQIASAAHEQPDTGSFTLHAFGERLLLDPGYLTFEQRDLVGKASDHNLILVDGQGPADPFLASILWVGDLAGLPPVDGQATISGTRDTAFLDTARVDPATRRPTSTVGSSSWTTAKMAAADTAQTGPDHAATPRGSCTATAAAPAAEPSRRPARAESGRTAPAHRRRGGFGRGTGHARRANRTMRVTTARCSRTLRSSEQHRDRSDHPRSRGRVPEPVQRARAHGRDTADDGWRRIRITDTADDRVVVAVHHSDGTVTIDDTHPNGTPAPSYSEGSRTLGTVTGPCIASRPPRRSASGERDQADISRDGRARRHADRLPFRAHGLMARTWRTPFGTDVRTGRGSRRDALRGAGKLRAGRRRGR